YLSIISVGPINASLLDDFHGAEVLLLAAFIGQASILPGHLYISMAQQQLQTFQAHAGIEQLACKGMPKTVDCVAFVLKPRLPQILYKDIAGRGVAQVTPEAVKEISFCLISLFKPEP